MTISLLLNVSTLCKGKGGLGNGEGVGCRGLVIIQVNFGRSNKYAQTFKKTGFSEIDN